jgi:hypothetical protein
MNNEDLSIAESHKPRLMPATQRYTQHIITAQGAVRTITVCEPDERTAKASIAKIKRELWPHSTLTGELTCN